MLVFTVGMGVPLAFAKSSPTSPQNFYGFQSAQLFAERRSELLPVVSTSKRGLYVQTKRGSKRVSYQSKVGLRRKIFVSGNLLEITEQKSNFLYLGDGAYEQNVIRQMQGLDFSYDVQMSELRQVSGGNYTQEMQQLEAERSEYRNLAQESVEEGIPDSDGLHDTLNIEIQMQAEHDVEDAFCVLIIPYITAESRDNTEKKTRTALRVQYLGDIPGGIPHQTSVQFDLSVGEYDPADYQLHFYAGNGQPLPPGQSKMLKKLTPEEVLDILGR